MKQLNKSICRICHLAVIIFLFSALHVAASDISSMGLLDVTKAPFKADPTGKQDCTKALQEAIDHAQKNHMVAFFPTGIYKISNTIHCRQDSPPMEERGKFTNGRYWGVTLLGSRNGNKRPKIVLAPRSQGFDNKDKPKIAINFYRGAFQPDPTKYPPFGPGFMNSRLIGIDVEIGEGNPGAIALRMRGAQGMCVEDVTIDATHGLVGLEGGNGSGGSNANVTIIGGEIGFDGSATQPTPCITGFRFIDQTKHAILYRGRNTLTATGISISSRFPITAVKAVDLWTKNETFVDGFNGSKNVALGVWNGPINFVDCRIEFLGDPGTAFKSNAGVYLNNCYIKNASWLVDHDSGGKLEGKKSAWVKINEYAQGYDMRSFKSLKYTCPIYIDGARQEEGIATVTKGVNPPNDLVSRHVWDEDFPSWESPGAVSVKDSPYNAKGDGITDDTKAIQKAIDENEIVIVPTGLYRISKTIDLRPKTKLIGMMSNHTGLIITEAEGDFTDIHNPKPLIRTADDADAETVIAFIGTWVPGDIPAYNLLWRSGRKSIVRDWMIMHETMQQPERTHHSVVVKGNGGGKWYNYYDETWSREYESSYRHLYVEGTSEPFRIYQCNPEHSRSEANMEIRNSKNVTLYGVKCEANAPAVLIKNSENIRCFGFGGNETPMAHTSVYQIENSKNILLTSLFNQPRLHAGGPEQFNGPNVDPTLFHMIIESFSDGREFIVPPLERPVIYKQGTTMDVW